MKKTNKKGFTIVELVIVIAVIAILAAVLIPTFAGVVEKANISAALQGGRNAYTAIMAETNATWASVTAVDGASHVVTASSVDLDDYITNISSATYDTGKITVTTSTGVTVTITATGATAAKTST